MNVVREFNNRLYLFFGKHQIIWCICLFLGASLVMISATIKDFFPYWYILLFLGLLFLAFFLIGMTHSDTDNYRVAILEAEKLRNKIINSDVVEKDTISKMMIHFINIAKKRKDPEELNKLVEDIGEFRKLGDQIEEKEILLEELPDEIKSLKENFLKLHRSLFG